MRTQNLACIDIEFTTLKTMPTALSPNSIGIGYTALSLFTNEEPDYPQPDDRLTFHSTVKKATRNTQIPRRPHTGGTSLRELLNKYIDRPATAGDYL